MNQFFRIALVLLEIFVFGNAILIAFVMGAWMESSSFASSASESDWWFEAGNRFIVGSVMAAFLSALVWFVNRNLFVWVGFKTERPSTLIASILFGSLCVSTLVGAINFAITKPYI
jgi:hypothetical protein